MALKGTIKDFGVADIFQLIGQQAKTGMLVFSNDVDEVRVYFIQGSVVRAQEALRNAEMLVGTLMVRAEVLSQERLDAALKEQQRTLKRLGDILVEQAAVTHDDLLDFAQLQLTETVYRLFGWKFGTYEFESQDVEPAIEGLAPIRAENIVMNGVRMMDEWPSIRERIPSYTWRVERMRRLPAPSSSLSGGFDFSLEDELSSASHGAVGGYERRVYELIAPGQTVQGLVDTSRLGEFETLSALSTLMSEGFVRVVRPNEHHAEASRNRLTPLQVAKAVVSTLARMTMSAALVTGALLLFAHVSSLGEDVQWESSPLVRHRAEAQKKILYRALDVFRYRTGRYPTQLRELIDAGLVSERDLSYPFEGPYDYTVEEGRAALYRPVR